MFKNMTIKKKMIIFILGLTVIIYSVTLGYTIYNLRSDAINEAKKLADTYASDKANDIKAKLDEDMAITRAMALIVQDYVTLPTNEREEMQFRLMKNILAEYPKYEAVWMSWQLQYIDTAWTNNYGRLSINCYWDNGNIKTSQERKDLTGFVTDGLYYRLLMDKEEVLTEPYEFDSYDVDADGTLLAVSPTKTLINEAGEPIGVIGTDMSLEEYSKMTVVEDYQQGYAFLASNNGTIVAHKNLKLTNKPLSKLDYYDQLDTDLLEVVKTGEAVSFTTYSSEFNGDVYLSIAPIAVGRSDAPWSVGIIVPYSEITDSINATFWFMIIVAIIGLLLLTAVILKISNDIVSSLMKTSTILKDISKGEINMENKLDVDSKNQLGQMSQSVNVLMDELNKKASFSKLIGEGNLEADFEVAGENDMLGHSLLEMRNSLKQAEKDSSRRRWANEGLAKFAEILQSDADNLDALCNDIISNLVRYMDIIQGGIFLINDEDENDKYIELKGAYAYDRKKWIDKRIEMNEGLVAQAMLEQKYLYLREVPEDYVNITSGLGEAKPNVVLIVPLMLNGEVFGALELVSFNEIEDYRIQFLEKLAENIASTVSSAKINYTTKKLLEQSKLQAEELKGQEEEMRQNMEELQATQEEMIRKEQEYLDKIKKLEENRPDKD
ncbi:GAF domain-containing protein [Fulvivirga lutimaris]|uniref:GAF domain-containing protein n=1 Tax=Fulvivirga lutimaris TaxID=1819566 RepID=UPI0012BC9828|nr:GAF domain-containing protein [Fulvivirga lutimaris]MTI39483.1 GAF domain-containing protein [Fulvivirga lutimaris]